MKATNYIPALRFKWLTPLYDSLVSITMPEKKFKESLIRASDISDEHRVMDFGCGTATLTIMTKQMYPNANVTGIDVDKAILDKAINKIMEKKLDVLLLDYPGKKLPFNDESFDRVISSLVFHHLDTESKKIALTEICRVLSNNGQLHIADFGRSESRVQRILFNIIRGFDGFKPTDANAKGLLPELISNAGFKNVEIKKRFKTMFGEVQIIHAEKNHFSLNKKI